MRVAGRPRRAPGVEKAVLDTEGVRLTPPKGAGSWVDLNPTSTLVWQVCNGERTVEDVLALFRDAYPQNPEVEQEVSTTIEGLLEKEFLLIDGGEGALEYQGEVVRKLDPNFEMQWQLEQIRRVLFGLLRVEDTPPLVSDLDSLLDEKALANAKELDVDSASRIKDSCVIGYQGALKSASFKACANIIIAELEKLLPEVDGGLETSGHAIYLKGSHMGWHSNHSRADGRVYCSWTDLADSNFFRYEHPLSGEIVTEWEKPGWNIKSFTIPPHPARFWHCIGASRLRLSLGFRYNLPE